MHDVGGNFGTRGMIYPEFALVAWAARRVGRPVKWTCERQEAFLSDYQGRDLAVDAELALDADGTFLAMRGSNIGNVGAHTANFSLAAEGRRDHVEHLPHAGRLLPRARRRQQHRARPAPTAARAGRKSCSSWSGSSTSRRANAASTASSCRRRNLLTLRRAAVHQPVRHGLRQRRLPRGHGEGARARRLGGLPRAPQAEARKRGKCRGIGVANYVDTATGAPRERAEITVHPEGRVDVVIGTVSQGQGHETSFAQLVTEWLGVPIEQVRIITGDTDIVKVGGGAHSGRGMRLGSIVIWNASQRIIEKGAAHRRACAARRRAREIEFERRPLRLRREPTARSICSRSPRRRASATDLPEDLRGPLAAFSDETINVASFPYGCHVCEVEVDPETGTVEIVALRRGRRRRAAPSTR